MELVRFIVYVLMDLAMTSAMIYSFSKMLSEKPKINYKKLVSILMLSCINIINNLYGNVTLRLLIAIIISIIINKIVFSKKYKETIILTIIYFVITFLIELFLFNIVPTKSIGNIYIFNNELIYKSIFSLLNILVILLVFKNKKIIKVVNKINIIIVDNVNLYVLFIILLFFINVITIFKGMNINNRYLSILLLITIIFIITFLKTIVNDKYNIHLLKNKNKNIKDSFKAYSETIDECREFKHNLKNDLYSLKTALPLEYQNSINNIIQKYNKKYDWINKIGDIPEGLQGIIFLKKNEALVKKVKINIMTTKNIDVKDKDYLDLADIVGILLDNAIEASSLTKQKLITLDIKETKKDTKIQIINTFNNIINVTKIGQKNYSTKEFKSGIGLNYIKNIKNSNIKVKFKIIDNLFITDIIYQR